MHTPSPPPLSKLTLVNIWHCSSCIFHQLVKYFLTREEGSNANEVKSDKDRTERARVRSTLYKPKVRNWKRDQLWPPHESGDENHSLETRLGRNHSGVFPLEMWIYRTGADSKAQNLFPTKPGFNSTIQSYTQAGSYGEVGSHRQDQSGVERRLSLDTEPILVQAFRVRERDEQTQRCEPVT